MTAYADSALLCSLYAPDANTRRAIARVSRLESPLPFVWLHQVELRNALRLRVFRGEITPAQRDQSLQAMLADLAAGALRPIDAAMRDVLLEAERLGAGHSERLGTRSLDILHVAFALVLGTGDFLGFDKRQLALARAAGMRTPRI